MLAINDFHFGRNPDDDYAFFDKLILKIDELSPRDHKYLLDSITLTHPFLKYEIYDYLPNKAYLIAGLKQEGDFRPTGIFDYL